MIEIAALATAALKTKLAKDFGADMAAKFAVTQQELLGTFNTYLERAYEQHRKLKSVVLRDSTYYLDDLYVPLRLKATSSQNDSKEVLLNEFPAKLFAEHRCVTVVDTAGMGKSTLSRYLFTQCARGGSRIPFLVDLRSLSEKRRLETALAESLCDVGTSPDPWKLKLITQLANSPDTVLFLDGYDEVSDLNKAEVSLDMQTLVAKSKCLVLMTSRQVNGLPGFAAFAHFSIQPLTRPESHELIRKYAKASAREDVGEQLIAEIEKPANRQVTPFLTNPLLTSLLFAAYEYKHEIPLKKTSFYGQVFDALFDRHDLSKPGGQLNRQKQSGLDRADFGVVIRKFSALTFRMQKFDYTSDELLNVYLPQVKNALPGIPFDAAGFVRDLVEAVPLFTIEGTKYRWAHRSLQEYFVACQICQDASGDCSKVLAEMAQSERVENYVHVLDLCSELAANEWRQSVLRVILQAWIDHRQNVTRHLGPLGIPRDQTDTRAAITGITNFGVGSDKSKSAGSSVEPQGGSMSRLYLLCSEAIVSAGEPYNAAIALGGSLSIPCAFPFVKIDQIYAIQSSKLEWLQLFEITRPNTRIDYQRLHDALGSKPEATNDFSLSLAINSVEHFDQFNDLIKRNCHKLLSWPRVDQLLDELNLERAQIEQASSNQAAW